MKHELPASARALIRDIAAQNVAFAQWVAGWSEGKGLTPGGGTLVITAAHIDVADDTEETA